MIDKLNTAINSNDDNNVLNVLIEETEKAVQLSNKKNISAGDFVIAELDQKNTRFIRSSPRYI